jgi:glutathione peroxidase
MRRIVVIAAVLAVVACQSTGKDPGKKAEYGDHAKQEKTPVNLPPPGTPPPATPVPADFASIWEVPLKTLDGKPTTLAAHKGKAVLVVNVASQCGLTPQYAALEAVQDKYAAKGFTVVGFPCNQFGGQEPGSAEEIAQFCSVNYGISFPIMEKIDVNGNARNPVYAKLTTIADAGGHSGDIRWNFEKFLISADGSQITRFSPKTKPEDPSVIGAIEAALPH